MPFDARIETDLSDCQVLQSEHLQQNHAQTIHISFFAEWTFGVRSPQPLAAVHFRWLFVCKAHDGRAEAVVAHVTRGAQITDL